MAIEVKISQLPSATAITGVEKFPAVQSGGTVAPTLAQVRAYTDVTASGFAATAQAAAIASAAITASGYAVDAYNAAIATASGYADLTASGYADAAYDAAILTASGYAVDSMNAAIATSSGYVEPLFDFRQWDTTRSYDLNDPVFYEGVPYRSLIVTNSGNTPDVNPDKWEVTGGGSDAVNPGFTLENGQFESTADGWLTYKDTATSVPEDGTGGTPVVVTFSRSTVSGLIGDASGVLSKSAVDGQGEGVGRTFTVDRGMLQNPVQVSFEYETTSGYASGDVGVYIYDTVGSGILYPSEVELAATYGNPSTEKVVFWPNSDSTDYRLIFHVMTSGTLAWDFKLDNVQVGTNNMVVGAAIGPTIQYPLTIGATTTAPTKGTIAEDIATWARHGDKMMWSYRYEQTAAGSAGNGTYLFPLPTGHEIDLTKHPINSTVGIARVSSASDGFAVSSVIGNVVVNSATTLRLDVINAVNTLIAVGSSAYNMGTASLQFNCEATFTISTWSANVNLNGAMDDEYLFNTQATINTNDTTSFGYGKGGAAILANTAATYYDVQLQKPMQITDEPIIEVRSKLTRRWFPATVASWPAAGSAAVFSLGASSAVPTGFSPVGIGVTDIGAQDKLRVTFNVYSAYLGTTNYTWANLTASAFGYDRWRVRIKKGASSSEIPPVVFADYTMSTSVSISTTPVRLNFDTKNEDTNVAVTTGASWVFTAPISGLYEIKSLGIGSGNAVALLGYSQTLWLNGVSQEGYILGVVFPAATGFPISGSRTIRVVKGDTLYITAQTNVSSLPAVQSRVQITRIGG